MPRARSQRRRRYDWAGLIFGATSISGTPNPIVGFSDTEDVTVVRVRGNVFIQATPNAIADDDVIGLGLIVVTDQAFAAGGASVPGPIANMDAEWMWHQFVPLKAAGTALAGNDIGTNVRVEVDTKAQRILKVNQTLAFVLELDTGEFTSVQATGGIRALAMH